jgi:hypothetical protein
MSRLGNKGRTTSGLSLVVTLAMAAMMMLYAGDSSAATIKGQGAGAGSSSFTKIAHDAQGFAKSKIVGETAKGKRVTGYFIPMDFAKHHGHLRVHGLVNGVIHKGDGTTRTFQAMRTLRVKTIEGQTPGAARAGAGGAACGILHLVLGPLDLDFLGLQVHLDRVLLNIVAQSGAGQLLGNLLCAVAHLLDTGGTLSQLLAKLGQILDQLLMGL